MLPNAEGRRSLLKLAERMTNNFCGGVSASANHTWITLSGTGADTGSVGPTDECRVVIRKSVDDPGRPPGIVLSAATSLWLPVSPSRVLQFLRDERYRTEVMNAIWLVWYKLFPLSSKFLFLFFMFVFVVGYPLQHGCGGRDCPRPERTRLRQLCLIVESQCEYMLFQISTLLV